MDKNKLQELHAIEYRIPKTCLLCKHGDFPQNAWGTCRIQTYAHQKHTGDARQLSIHMAGSCSKCSAASDIDQMLGAYREFLETVPAGVKTLWETLASDHAPSCTCEVCSVYWSHLRP